VLGLVPHRAASKAVPVRVPKLIGDASSLLGAAPARTIAWQFEVARESPFLSLSPSASTSCLDWFTSSGVREACEGRNC
jgi:hypothetical protein